MTTAIKDEAKQAATGPAEHVAGFPAEGGRIPSHIECVGVPTIGARDDPAPVVVEKDAGSLQLICHDGLSPLLRLLCWHAVLSPYRRFCPPS
jgi:hypothetical protein